MSHDKTCSNVLWLKMLWIASFRLLELWSSTGKKMNHWCVLVSCKHRHRWCHYGESSYLDFNSHHDIKHKESTTATLLHRALIIPNTTEGRNWELDKVNIQPYSPMAILLNLFTISRQEETCSSMIPSLEELVGMFFELVEPLKPYNSFASPSVHQRCHRTLNTFAKKTRY